MARHISAKRGRIQRLLRGKWGSRRVAATIVALALVGGGGVAITAPAQAASLAAGFSYAGGFIGGYALPNGQTGYCIDPGYTWPNGAPTSDAGLITGYTSQGENGQNVAGVDSNTLGKVNYLVTNYGQTGDPVQATAVAIAIARTVNEAAFQAHTAPYGQQYYSTYMSASNWTRAKALIQQFRDEAANFTPGSGSGTASMAFAVDNNNYKGSITITSLSPSPAYGTITLTDGKFDDGTTSKTGNWAAGQSLGVVGVPPAGNFHYEIAGHGDWGAPGGPGGNVHLFTTPGRQGLAAPGSSSASSWSADARDPFERSALFAPVATTQAVSVFVKRGAIPQDDITFQTTNFVDEESGQTVNNPWPQRGSGAYFQLLAKGTWYGPSSSPLQQSKTVPSNIPVAGHATVTTSAAAGPTTSYRVSSDTPALEAGYYTWVWAIDAADQEPGMQSYLPTDYLFTDDFGQAPEGQISPSSLTFATQLSSPTATEADELTDTITPTLTGGAWLLSSGGTRVPVTLRGEVYWEAEKPVQASAPPAGAEHLQTIHATLTGPAATESEPFMVGYKTGYVTVQWSLHTEDQPPYFQGLFDEYSDDYGVPAETAQVFGPTVTTKAANTGPGGIVTDTATVKGPIPTVGVDLTWTGYLRPDTTQPATCAVEEPPVDEPTEPGPPARVADPDAGDGTDPAAGAPEEQPHVWGLVSKQPTVVTEPGDYPSENFNVPDGFIGAIDWVETVKLHDTDIVLSQGQCGAEGETSISALPTVVTTPPAEVKAKATAHDTLMVNGWVTAGTTAVVHLYKQADGAAALTCDASTEVGSVLGPITIDTGKILTDAKYVSPETAALAPGQYGFVEQLLDEKGDVITEGDCHAELFTVQKELASTGTDTMAISTATSAALLLLISGALLIWCRRRVDTEATELLPLDQ